MADWKVTSLYIHIPFCVRKCGYCAFYSARPESGQIERFLQNLAVELEWAAPQLDPQTIYIGGGTPSLLNLPQWETLLAAIHKLGWRRVREWTVECNPSTLSLEKARLLKAAGVNRVSLGVQSLQDDLLERLGRVHTRREVFESYDLLRQAGFENVNLDLMFAIPGQTLEVWRETLREIVHLGSEHLSSYEVTYEEDTPLFEQLQASQREVDEDLVCAMYDELVDFGAARGYRQYEISNFARHLGAGEAAIPDRACAHNVNYWRGGHFLGLGPSAASYAGESRTRNWANTSLYCELIEQGKRPVESEDRLPPLCRAGEIAAFGLRMNVGWDFEEFYRITHYDLREHWGDAMRELTAKGLALSDARNFKLTRQGLRFADYAASQFLQG